MITNVIFRSIRCALQNNHKGAEDQTVANSRSLYLGVQGDLVSRVIMGINGLTIWVIGAMNLLTKSP